MSFYDGEGHRHIFKGKWFQKQSYLPNDVSKIPDATSVLDAIQKTQIKKNPCNGGEQERRNCVFWEWRWTTAADECPNTNMNSNRCIP
jgi:hypothetical protein